jgi:hypothetical protein
MSKLAQFLAASWRVLVTVAAALVGYAASVAAAMVLTRESPGAPLLAIFIYLPALYVSIVIHELGHAAGAKLAGWRVHVISVGHLAYRPVALRFERVHRAGRRYRGWVLATPPLWSSWDKGRSLFIFGGPAANLLTAAICFPWITALQSYQEGHASDLAVAIGCLSLNSLAIGVSNLIPFWTSKGNPSDGARLLQLALGQREIRGRDHLVWLYAQQIDGTKATEWDPNLVREVENFDGTAEEKTLRDVLLLSYYFSFGNVARAKAVTDRHALSTVPKSPNLMIEHAFLIALIDKRATEALRILGEIPEQCRKTFQYWRAVATARSLSGDFAGAGEAVKQAEAFAAKNKSKPDEDDRALFSAIENGLPLPDIIQRTAPA